MDATQRHRFMLLEGLRDFDPNQPRIPSGHHGGGRWGSLAGSVLHGLREAIASGEARREAAAEGQNSTTAFVTHKNGTRTVHKVIEDATDIVGRGNGDPKRQTDAEHLGAHLGTLIGAPVPHVLRTADNEVWMNRVDGTSLAKELKKQRDLLPDLTASQAEEAALRAELANSDDGFRLGVFDLLTANWDRNNAENVLVTPDRRPVGIDHSFLWQDDVDPDPEVPPPATWGLSPFALQFVEVNGKSGRWTIHGTENNITGWADNPLTPADVDWLRARLAAVEHDFTAAGHHDWWQFASDRLEAIAPYATGTRSRLAS